MLNFSYDSSSNHTEIMSDGTTLRCVTTDRFKDLRPLYHAITPTNGILEEHRLCRGLVDDKILDSIVSARFYNSTAVDIMQTEKSFQTYHRILEGGPHGIIDSALGGDMNLTPPNGQSNYHTSVRTPCRV